MHPTDDYDVLIQLDQAVLPRYFQNVAIDSRALSRGGKYANLPPTESDPVVRPGFDPARLLFSDLQVRSLRLIFRCFNCVCDIEDLRKYIQDILRFIRR